MPSATSARRRDRRRFSCLSVIASLPPQQPVLGDDAEEKRQRDRADDQGRFCVLRHLMTGWVSKVWYGTGVGRCVHSSESAPSQGFCGAGTPLRMVLITM